MKSRLDFLYVPKRGFLKRACLLTKAFLSMSNKERDALINDANKYIGCRSMPEA